MTPFFVVGGVCIIFAVPLFLLTSKVPCKYYSLILLCYCYHIISLKFGWELNLASKLKSVEFSSSGVTPLPNLIIIYSIDSIVLAATEISRRVLPIKSLFQIMTNVIAAMLGNGAYMLECTSNVYRGIHDCIR